MQRPYTVPRLEGSSTNEHCCAVLWTPSQNQGLSSWESFPEKSHPVTGWKTDEADDGSDELYFFAANQRSLQELFRYLLAKQQPRMAVQMPK